MAVGGDKVLVLDLSTIITAGDIKDLVLAKEDIPLDYQHLHWNGEELSDDAMILTLAMLDMWSAT